MTEFEEMKTRVLAKMGEPIEPPPFLGVTKTFADGTTYKLLDPMSVMRKTDIIGPTVLDLGLTYWRKVNGSDATKEQS